MAKIEFFEISDYEPIDSKVLYKKDKGLYGIKEPNSRLEDSSIQIAYNSQENCNQVYYNGHKIRKKEPLILKEGDEQEQITENFEQEHEQAPIGKTNQKTNEWDLTQEDKKRINEGAIKIASKHINGEQISHEHSNIESKQEENILS